MLCMRAVTLPGALAIVDTIGHISGAPGPDWEKTLPPGGGPEIDVRAPHLAVRECPHEPSVARGHTLPGWVRAVPG